MNFFTRNNKAYLYNIILYLFEISRILFFLTDIKSKFQLFMKVRLLVNYSQFR
jgi:hypothetical protein